MSADEAPLDRPHVWRRAPGGTIAGPPLLLLHGTGGDEHTLLPLAEQVSPTSPVLSVRGSVLEKGMNRHFRRLEEGVLDEDDLVRRTHELADFVTEAAAAYHAPRTGWVPIGFSNGANIATALLLLRPELVAGTVSIAAMPPFVDLPPVPTAPRRRAMIVNGDHDPLVSAEMTDGLVAQLESAGAGVRVLRHSGGHEVSADVLGHVAEYVATLG